MHDPVSDRHGHGFGSGPSGGLWAAPRGGGTSGPFARAKAGDAALAALGLGARSDLGALDDRGDFGCATGFTGLGAHDHQNGAGAGAGVVFAGGDSSLAPVDSTGGGRAGYRPLVLVENELWPARLRAADNRGVPVLVIGARISVRSARRRR